MNQEVTTFQEKQYVWIWSSHESLAIISKHANNTHKNLNSQNYRKMNSRTIIGTIWGFLSGLLFIIIYTCPQLTPPSLERIATMARNWIRMMAWLNEWLEQHNF